MNISRLSQSTSNLQPASARPASSQSKASTAPEQRVEAPAAQVERPEASGHAHSTRVANFASQIDARLQNAIEDGNLSADQIASLKAASEQFQALMGRIAAADFSHSPKRQVLFALSQLQEQIQGIFHPQDDAQPGRVSSALAKGDDLAGAKSAPKIDALA